MRPLQVGQQPFTKLTQARSVPHLGHPILHVSKPNQFHQMLAKFFAIQNPCKRLLHSVIPTYWGGPPLGVQNLCRFPTPKTGIKQIEQFNMSPGLRKKAQDAQDAVLRFLKFSVSVALTRRLRFLRFLNFSVYCTIYKMNRGFECNTIRRGPQAGGHQGSGHHPPESS